MHRNISFQRIIFSFTMALMLVMPTSCFRNYYKVSKKPVSASSESINTLKKESRYFILRTGIRAFHMKNVSVSTDQKTIHCDLAYLPFEHQLHLQRGERRGNRQYKLPNPTRVVIDEVHFYIPPDTTANEGEYSFATEKVHLIEVLQKDGARTVGSYVGGLVGIAAAIAGTVFVIAALTSCPFVSPYDGKDFSLQGEIYGGSVYPQLARHDYIKLNMAPNPSNNLQLKISNELKEIQHTDLAELITITHSRDVSIHNDQEGNIYSIKKAEQPFSAISKSNTNVSALLAVKDSRAFQFNDSTSANGSNDLTLHFKKPSNGRNGKLILRVKNTFWLDHLYGKMLEGFGDYYNTFTRSQEKKSAEELNKWTADQMIPLKVSVKVKDGWKVVTDLKTSGPVAFRDVVVPIDCSDTNEITTIKLSSGFMFWEIDYAAMDYSANEIISVQKQLPTLAIDETGKDVSDLLSAPDSKYLDQPTPGNVTTVTYNYSAPLQEQAQSYILHCRGWYETLREFKGKPDVAFLEQFKKPAALSRFSVEQYNKQQSAQQTTVKK